MGEHSDNSSGLIDGEGHEGAPQESSDDSPQRSDEIPKDRVERGDEESSESEDNKSPVPRARQVAPGDDLRALRSVLRRTRRALRRPLIIEGAIWYGVTLLAVVLSSLAVAGLISDGGYTAARWILALGMAAATLGAVSVLGLFLWRRPTLEHVASRIQRHATEFRSDLVAALEFGHALDEDGGQSLRDSGFSPALARVHLSRTVRKVYEHSERNSLAHLVPRRDLTPPILALSGAVALMAVPLIVNPGWTLGVLSGERIGTPVVGERVVKETVVGNLEGVFVYPSYTGQDRQVRQLGTGFIESLEGTEVHLQATLMPGEWAEVEMIMETGDEGERQVIAMDPSDGHRVSTSITLKDSGHYWFRAKTMEGRPVEEPSKRRIRVRRNEAPQVEVTSHAGRVAVQPDDIITFDLEVSDSFGIDSMTKLHHFQGSDDEPTRSPLNLSVLSSDPTHVETEVTFDLSPLQLEPKDAVVVSFEARDNNTTTGPSVGESEAILLYVESPEDKHMRNIAQQQQVMEALLNHLADFLESPVGERKFDGNGSYRQAVRPRLEDRKRIERYQTTRGIHRQRDQILERMDNVIARLDEDPLMSSRDLTLFEGLRERLEDLHDDGDQLFGRLDSRADRRDLTVAHVQEVADYASHSEEEIERGVLNLEELLISQKMALVEATAEDIERLRDRLRDLLEQYRDTDDPELKEAIQREIQRLRQRMQELMARMQMQMREMPREHVNLEAMEGMEMQSQAESLGEQLDALQDMLDNDDIDGALAALDEMEAHLDAMNTEMGDSFSQMQPQGLSELDQAVSEMMDEVNTLRDMEQALEEETRQLQEELREERREKLEEMLAPVVEELLQKIEAQQQALDEMEDRQLAEQDRSGVDRAADRMDDLQEMVEQEDMEQALERARAASSALRSMRSTMNLSQRYIDSNSQAGRDLDASVEDAAQMVDRGRAIEEKIEDFMDQAQQDLQPDEEERFDELAQDQSDIRERANELNERIQEQSEQYPQLEQTLQPSMEGAQEAMENAEEHLRERQVQQALDNEREALEHLGQLGDSMSQALQQQRQQEREESGQRPGEQDEVEIPGEDSGEMRERLRQEMMEGMREGRIEAYESEIERYFRSLVE